MSFVKKVVKGLSAIFITSDDLVTLGITTPSSFVDWSTLGFFDGYTSAIAPFGVARSRIQGDQVVLSGLVVAPMAGFVGSSHITNLPTAQQPSSVRIMTCSYQVGAGSPVINTIGVDNRNGSLTGTPGAVVVGFDVAAGGALLFLDGLSFAL